MHRLRLFLFAALVVGSGAVAEAQTLPDLTCDGLWWERNNIYRQAGYCFRTARAIREFGNAGCLYDQQSEVPLSARDRRYIAEIQSWERRRGCPR